MHDQRIGSYIVVSPVKDEERYIETTILSMLKQSLRPKKWIIVDDGSRDRTPEILQTYAEQCDWMQTLTIRRDASRKLGSAEIRAFQAGYELVRDDEFDLIVKLDGDLDLPANYFERLVNCFAVDENLGIASGSHLEKNGHKWLRVVMPPYHAAGASKMVRRQCFEGIGGFPLNPGWDTADEIKAQARGWKTCHMKDLDFYHLRPEGSSIGYLKEGLLCGEVYYVCGGGGMFLTLKLLDRIFSGRPILLNAMMLFCGYLRARWKRKPLLVNSSEAAFYRRQLNQRILERVFPSANRSNSEKAILRS